MARLFERLEMAEKAVCRLQEVMALDNPGLVERDAAIQRFEFTFEAVWKAAKAFLAEHEGIEAASPKSAIRSCREVGILDDDEATMALVMADDRNLTVHTYNESLAVEIYSRLKDYSPLLNKWLIEMKNRSRRLLQNP